MPIWTIIVLASGVVIYMFVEAWIDFYAPYMED